MSKRTGETHQGMWLGKAEKDSFRLGDKKWDLGQLTKTEADSLAQEQLGKLGEEEMHQSTCTN